MINTLPTGNFLQQFACHSYSIERQSSLLSAIVPKPYQCLLCLCVYLPHESDLVIFLHITVLINANSISPENAVSSRIFIPLEIVQGAV
jgi:hypothetical protein